MGMKDFDSAKWFTVYANMINSDLRKEALKLRGEVFALESKLKAAEEKLAATCMVSPVYCESAHTIKENKDLKENLAKRVPFEVMSQVLTDNDCCDDCDHNIPCHGKTPNCTPEYCPLIPKVKTDDIQVEESDKDKDELEYMQKLADSIEHDTMPPER
jgi:hypothetical protein